MNVAEAIVEGLIKRGVKSGVDITKFIPLLKKGQSIPVHSKGWPVDAVKMFETNLAAWDKIVLRGSNLPVSRMPVEKFMLIENINELMTHDWAQKYNVNRYYDQLFDKFLKKGKPFGHIKATSTAQATKNIPKNIYQTTKAIIENSFNGKPLQKLTAEFFDITGHRAKETSRLTIEMFTDISEAKEASNYGGTKNLHAEGWKMKGTVPKLGHFSPAAKIVIFNALELAKKQNRISGPLFPDAAKVDKIITTKLQEVYGKKSIRSYTYGAAKGEMTSPTRKFFRNIFKARDIAARMISPAAGTGLDILSGGVVMDPKMKVKAGYLPVNIVEDIVNQTGKITDDMWVAFSDRRSIEQWAKKNNYKIPPELLDELSPIKKSNIAIGRSFMNWIPPTLRNFYGIFKFGDDIPFADLTPDELNREIAASKAEGKYQAAQKIVDAEAKFMKLYNQKVEFLMSTEGGNYTRATAEYKAQKILDGEMNKTKKAKKTGFISKIIGGSLGTGFGVYFGGKHYFNEAEAYESEEERTKAALLDLGLGIAPVPLTAAQFGFGTKEDQEEYAFNKWLETNEIREKEEEYNTQVVHNELRVKSNLIHEEEQKKIKRAFEDREIELARDEQRKKYPMLYQEEDIKPSIVDPTYGLDPKKNYTPVTLRKAEEQNFMRGMEEDIRTVPDTEEDEEEVLIEDEDELLTQQQLYEQGGV